MTEHNGITIPELDDDRILRHVKIGGAVLLTWDAYARCNTGQHRIGYALWASAEDALDAPPLFCGDDCGVSPMHAIDSDDALIGLLSFLTLKPGDTDEEYFADYTAEQLAWCKDSQAEAISMHVYDHKDHYGEHHALAPFEDLREW